MRLRRDHISHRGGGRSHRADSLALSRNSSRRGNRVDGRAGRNGDQRGGRIHRLARHEPDGRRLLFIERRHDLSRSLHADGDRDGLVEWSRRVEVLSGGADGRREIFAGDLRALQKRPFNTDRRDRYKKHRPLPGFAAGGGLRRELDGQARTVRGGRFREGETIGRRGRGARAGVAWRDWDGMSQAYRTYKSYKSYS